MSALTAPAPVLETDYDMIEAAVMETARGRWFLAEYARRNRQSDTLRVLDAISRLEQAMAARARDPETERIRMDIVEMANAIARTKAEIAAIRPDTTAEGRIGEATGELDAIVDTTESATSDILHAAEQVQEVAWTLREQGFENAVCDLLDERATDIYTACSFQDLTGQRTRKVIHVLRFLEARINSMIDIWGLDGVRLSIETPDDQPEGQRLASGPARPGEGLAQGDIDAVMVVAAEAAAVSAMDAIDGILDVAAADDEPIGYEGDTVIEVMLDLDAAPDEDEPDGEPVEPVADVEPAPVLVTVSSGHDDFAVVDAAEPHAPSVAAPRPSRIVVLPESQAPRISTSDIEALTPAEKIALFG